MVLLNYFSLVKLMKDPSLFSFSSIFMVWVRKISISSIYLKYVVLLVSLYLKGTYSKNYRNRQANTLLDFPWRGHIFFCRNYF